MTAEFLLALAGFAFVTSITPGPNNLMLMASGVNFGLRRTMPHLLGISLGLATMIVLVGLGAARAMESIPLLELALRAGCLAFIMWMTWSLLRAEAPDGAPAKSAPMTFIQAAGFQWINPKAWAMALTAIAAFAPDRSLPAVGTVAVVFAIVSLPSIVVWAALGKRLRAFLTDARRRRIFNAATAALLVVSVLPMILQMG
ncbi:LysE family translocator [Meridianimarinicoccus sp. RP-17]|uniref:LysE family translocator n=1 Tax=Meridianimarinicoccus zhengii TaxID=2056810 RepID=UPI000DAF3476|nr:LysE family translocator [Phycocomes zhengii]